MSTRRALASFAICCTVVLIGGRAWAHEEISPTTIPTGRANFVTLLAANGESTALTKLTLTAPDGVTFGDATRQSAGWTAEKSKTARYITTKSGRQQRVARSRILRHVGRGGERCEPTRTSALPGEHWVRERRVIQRQCRDRCRRARHRGANHSRRSGCDGDDDREQQRRHDHDGGNRDRCDRRHRRRGVPGQPRPCRGRARTCPVTARPRRCATQSGERRRDRGGNVKVTRRALCFVAVHHTPSTNRPKAAVLFEVRVP